MQAINLHALTNGAHFQLMTNIREKTLTATAVTRDAPSYCKTLFDAIEAEDKALKLTRKSGFTDGIAAADAERDRLYLSYKAAIKALQRHPDEQKSAAAKRLYQHIKDYGIVVTGQLDKETGLLKNLIFDLEGDRAADIATLDLGTYVQEIKEANAEVHRLTIERTEERTTQTVGVLQAARIASDKAFRALVEYLEAREIALSQEDYKDYLKYVDTEITQFKRAALKQKATATRDTTTPTTDGTTTDGGGGDTVQGE